MMLKKVLCILNFEETKESWQKLKDKLNLPNLILKKKNLYSYILKTNKQTNKNWCDSTGNYIKCIVITYNGKESEKEPIYMYMHNNHFAVKLKINYSSIKNTFKKLMHIEW